jgi:hypothetical protein
VTVFVCPFTTGRVPLPQAKAGAQQQEGISKEETATQEGSLFKEENAPRQEKEEEWCPSREKKALQHNLPTQPAPWFRRAHAPSPQKPHLC